MKTKWIVAASVPVLLAGAALIAPSFIDWEKYKPQIISGLEGASGHVYEINGPISLSILPSPRANIEKLSVAQPASMGGEIIASIDRASVSVALAPLLQKQIKVNNVTLERPVINL